MQIKQNTASLALVFYMVDSADHATPKTGLSPTVTLSKNGGSLASPAGAVSQIGSGLYQVAPNATDSNTLGTLALIATAAGADQASMKYEVVANIESDSIAAVAALTAPDNAGIAAIKAKTDNLPASPAATGEIPTVAAIADAVWDEAMAGHVTAGTAGSQLTAAGASGDPWASVVPAAYADGTAGAAIGRLNNTPAAAPVIVVPAPDEDANLTVVYAYTESITNEKRAGVVLTFKLVTTPAKSERLLEAAAKTATTDADGYAQISLQSGLRYRVTCRELGLEKTFTPTGETFNLLTLIP